MSTLNLGILAHVDAGKTSLTERLLHAAGVIDEIGRVDDGSTQTDSLALERQRGITIKSAVVSFAVDDITVNLIDTPGHPDFIAEVERVLSVLDGAVLVVSAVEGVQAQTRVLLRTLRRLEIPTLIFVNKIDRSGADPEGVVRAIAAKLTPAVVSMNAVRGAGTPAAVVDPPAPDDPGLAENLTQLLADHDEALLAAYVDDRAIPAHRLRDALVTQVGRAVVHPVFSGSAVTGAGVDLLTTGIRTLLPAATGDPDGPVSGVAFKVERGPAGEKIAYVRMLSGTLRVREPVEFGRPSAGREAPRRSTDGPGADGPSLDGPGAEGPGARGPGARGPGADGPGDGGHGEPGPRTEGKVTAIGVFDRGAVERRPSVGAGRIAKVWGLGEIRIGDRLGSTPARAVRHHFAPPTLEAVVVPRRPRDRGALHVALGQLAEQDPLINLRHDGLRHETFVSLYGEVQKEVIQATLATDYGIEVAFRETTTVCIERPVGTGTAVEVIGDGQNPFLATVGLCIEPAPVGSGVGFRLGIEPGSLPPAFRKAVENTVHATLRQGLHGWQVTDCTVTLVRSGYWARQSHAHAVFDKSMSSTAGDFRSLTPLVLMSALHQAGTTVLEPMHRFRLEFPADGYAHLVPALIRLGAVPHTTTTQGATSVLVGDVPADRVHELEQQLPGLTSGEGVLDSGFDHYEPVRGPIPRRSRSDHDPLNRREYLLRVTRRVPGT